MARAARNRRDDSGYEASSGFMPDLGAIVDNSHTSNPFADRRRADDFQRRRSLEDTVEDEGFLSKNKGLLAVGGAALGAGLIAYLNSTESGENLVSKIDSIMALWRAMEGDLVKENIDDVYAIIRGNYTFEQLDSPEAKAYIASVKGTPEYENFYKVGERFVRIDNVIYPMAVLGENLLKFIS